jgi:hypothetical protein
MPSRTSVAKYIRSSLNFSVERKFCKAFPIWNLCLFTIH